MGSPGLKFNPTEEELVFHYLRKKNSGFKEKLELIPEADVFKCEPWDLPERSHLPMCNNQWHFFSPRDWKYPSGSLAKRATDAGYWRYTRRFKTVHSQSSLTGTGKTLSFYLGRPPHGERTEWMMNEYHLDVKESETGAGLENAFVLCHLKNDERNASTEMCCLFPENGNVSSSEGSKSEDTVGEIFRHCQNPNTDSSSSDDPDAFINGDYIELNDILDSDSFYSGIHIPPASSELDTGSTCASDSRGLKKKKSEIENFATGNEVINRMDESSRCQKQEAIDPAIFLSSVLDFTHIPVSHNLSPTSLQPSPVLNVEPSATIHMLPDTFEMGVKIRVTITEKIRKSNMNEHTCFQGCVEESDESSDVEHLHVSENSVSENPRALPSQDEPITFGGSLPNAVTLSPVRIEESSALNTSEGNSTTSSPKEGSKSSSLLIRILSSIHGSPASAMELPPDWKSNKQILGLENTANSGTLSDPVISDPVGALTVKKVPSKGTFEYPKLETASSGLRARSVERSNIVGGGKQKRRETCEHSAGPSSSSSVQPRAPSGLFSQLSKRVSLTGSVALTRLFAAAFLLFLLFLLSSIMGIFASTYSAIAF